VTKIFEPLYIVDVMIANLSGGKFEETIIPCRLGAKTMATVF